MAWWQVAILIFAGCSAVMGILAISLILVDRLRLILAFCPACSRRLQWRGPQAYGYQHEKGLLYSCDTCGIEYYRHPETGIVKRPAEDIEHQRRVEKLMASIN